MASSTDPDGTTALVVGGSSGIGLAVAEALRTAGARVGVVARTEDRLRRVCAAIGAEPCVLDATDAGEVDRLTRWVEDRFETEAPDILVHATGAFDLSPLAETPVAAFDRMIAANLRAPFLTIRAFLPAMLRRGAGHIVTIGSVAGRQAFPENGAYSASKFGVRGMHAVLDVELRGSGVRSTLVEPAATDTPLWDAVDFERHPGLPPRHAMLDPRAVADAVLFAVTRPAEVDIRTIAVEGS